MPANPNLIKTQGQFRQAAQQGVELTQLMERGQASMPLGQHFQNIADETKSAPFAIILMGLTQERKREPTTLLT